MNCDCKRILNLRADVNEKIRKCVICFWFSMFQRFYLSVTGRPPRPVGMWWIFSSVKKEKWWRSLLGGKDSILPSEGRFLSGDKSKWVSQLKMNNNICTMYIGHSCQRSLLFPVGFWPDFYNFDHIFKIWTTFDIIDNMYHNLHSISQLCPDLTEGKADRTRETWMSLKPDWHKTYTSKL